MIKKILVLIAVSILLIVSVLFYFGAFNSYQVKEKMQGGFVIYGVEHKGSYKKIGEAFGKVSEFVTSNPSIHSNFIGEYFDNPATVKEENLRSVAGFITDSANLKSIMELDSKSSKPLNGKTFFIPKQNAFFIEAETNGMISQIIAAIKAYPMLHNYLGNKKNIMVTHVYEIYEDHKTIFIMNYTNN